MWELLAFFLTVLGALFVYLTNKNQSLLSKSLPRRLRLVSSMLLLFALICWIQAYVFSAALFLWLFITLTVFICIPLLSLFHVKDKKTQPVTRKSNG